MTLPRWNWRKWKWIVLAVSCLLTAGLAFVLTAVLSISDPTQASAFTQPDPIIGGDAENIRYDAGEVIAGTVVRHDFSFRNDWDEPIEIRKSEDIVIHCGCSSIEPAAHRLAPGESTRISVTLRTLGRMGVFANGGEVKWTAASGKRRKIFYTLRAEVRPALQVSDEILVFDDEAEPGTATKEISFTATKVPIEWDSLRVTVTAPFRLVKVDKSKDYVRCVVSHPKENEREEITGRIQAEAQLRGAKRGEGHIVTATVGLRWRTRQDDLRIIPRTVRLAKDKSDGRYKARLYLSGKRVEQHQNMIRSASYEGYTVEWKLLPAVGKKAAILELIFISSSGTKTSENPLLRLDFSKSKLVQLPVLVIERDNEIKR